MKPIKKYTKDTQDFDEFTERIGRVIKNFSNDHESISIEELERRVAEDKERRRIKNRVRRILTAVVCRSRLKK